ncbi:Epoxide hydrolase 3 [Phytophthora boehmeriae]|uniref:Epoxide hydrolase 3 n=1 Tax=Phytophthora boehmeriae TaxID=109152 RepID=A0A8T1WKZ5_9STRA|nr:Epoxide hydrolase 3 [Phytophthora boehmeriae]
MTRTSEWEQLPHKFSHVSDTVRLHYVDTGAPASDDSVPVVLLHGWPDFSFAWRHQLSPLSAKYRIIVPDMRGFGQSSAPSEASAYGSKNVTSDLAKLLDVLGIEEAVFIGHDWGATMSWRMCLYYPECVAAVCSVDIPYFPPSDHCTDIDALVKVMPQFSYLKLLGDSEATAQQLSNAPRRFFDAVFHHTAEIPSDLARIIENVENGDDAWYTAPSTLLSSEELEYYHPALYIATTRSSGDDPAQQQMMAGIVQMIPKLKTTIVHEAGHWVLWEKKEVITATLLEWLAQIN